MSAQTVTSAYQEIGELKLLAVENWKNIYNYLQSNPDKTPNQISPTKPFEHQFHLKIYVDLTT
jgi:hypothetical protein